MQVSYDSPLELAMQLIKDIVKQYPRIKQSPEPTVQVKGFAESGIDLILTFWITAPEDGSATLQSDIFIDIWQAFKSHNIAIPFPQREVRILNTEAKAMDIASAAPIKTPAKATRGRKAAAKDKS
jgi:small-conductance mechanosensitive channel